jgi:uncharacterized RDD family membrane protein YckC
MERPPQQPGAHTDTCRVRVGAVVIAGSIACLSAANPVRSALRWSGVDAILSFVSVTDAQANYGQTPGKKLLSIVVTENCDPCKTDDAVVWNLLRFGDALPAFSLLGAIVLFVSDEDSWLGDRAAETVLARVDRRGE